MENGRKRILLRIVELVMLFFALVLILWLLVLQWTTHGAALLETLRLGDGNRSLFYLGRIFGVFALFEQPLIGGAGLILLLWALSLRWLGRHWRN